MSRNTKSHPIQVRTDDELYAKLNYFGLNKSDIARRAWAAAVEEMEAEFGPAPIEEHHSYIENVIGILTPKMQTFKKHKPVSKLAEKVKANAENLEKLAQNNIPHLIGNVRFRKDGSFSNIRCHGGNGVDLIDRFHAMKRVVGPRIEQLLDFIKHYQDIGQRPSKQDISQLVSLNLIQ